MEVVTEASGGGQSLMEENSYMQIIGAMMNLQRYDFVNEAPSVSAASSWLLSYLACYA